MNAKHTPGPWALGQPGAEQFEGVLVPDGKRVIWAPDGMEVALVRDRGGETSENACLIAAASELLDALQDILSLVVSGAVCPFGLAFSLPCSCGHHAAVNAACAAIDKAEGVTG